MVLSCPNCFFRKRVMDHFGATITNELKKRLGKPCALEIEILSRKKKAASGPPRDKQLALPHLNVQPHYGRMLNQDYTFDHFVVGNNNDFAYSASLSLASGNNNHQKTLFLLSKTGMGKSHLSQAVGHHILSKYPTERVYYITAEDFTNEMVYAIRNDGIQKFKAKYRNQCDVLLMEDVQFLSGKEKTQLELAMTLDNLFDNRKKLIFTSCYAPSDIPKLDDKLRSLLSFGMISTIEPPDFRTRVRILKKKAMLNGYSLPEDVIRYLAEELTADIRQLESGLIGVTAKASLLGLPIDQNLAESIVKSIVKMRKNITVETIKKIICKQYKVSMEDLNSKSRKKLIVVPRQIAMYLARKYTDTPLQAIGKSFKRYHATVLHSINTVEKKMKIDHGFKNQVEHVCRRLENGSF